MKILTVCAGAVCRSVGMAYVLKRHFQHDALAISYDYNAPSTFLALSRWAKRIVVMQPHFADRIPEKYKPKVRVCDVGRDIWVDPLNEELLEKCFIWIRNGGLD